MAINFPLPYPQIEFPYTNVHQLNLDWVLKVLKQMLANLNAMAEKLDEHSEQLADITARIQDIEQFIEDFNSGKFDQLYLQLLWKWMQEYMPEVVAGIVKYVFFGLTKDGYFCAYIPDSWDFINFDTIAQGPLFGHLVLKW